MTTIVFDCDDVLMDWLGGFRAWIKVRHGIVPADPEPHDWDMTAWLGGRDALPLVSEFNSSAEFGDLQPLPGAVSALQSLYRAGYKLKVLSSCVVEGAPVVLRRETNLVSHFGPIFSSIVCLPLGASKGEILFEMPTSIYVEDNHGHAIRGHNAGHETWLIRRPHNAKFKGDLRLEWIDSVSDMVSRLH